MKTIFNSSANPASYAPIGTLGVPQGGTGDSNLPAGFFLTGNDEGPVLTTVAVPAGAVVGTTDTQTLSNKTMTVAAGNSIQTNSIYANLISSAPASPLQVLVAEDATDSAWTTLTPSYIFGTIPVSQGGTGDTTLTSGNFLVGAGTSAVTTTKAAPSGNVVGDSDTQTLTNKTLLAATNSVQATSVQLVSVTGTAPTTGQVLIATSGTTAIWNAISDISITGTISVPHGGTGVATLGYNMFLAGAGVAPVTTTKVVPSGTVVGTTDSQTLTNKVLSSTANYTIDATNLQTVAIATGTPTTNQTLTYNGSAAQWLTPTAAALSGVVAVSQGGTGVNTLGYNMFLVGAGAAPVVTTKAVPSGNVVGDSDAQTLTNKVLASTNNYTIDATNLQTHPVYNVAPTAGQALVYDGANARWAPTTLGDVTGPGSSTDTAIVRWNGTTGLVIENSSSTLSAAGNLSTAVITLPSTSSSTNGVINNGLGSLMHTYSSGSGQNIFLGSLAGNFSVSGTNNTALGIQSGQSLTSGLGNILVGTEAGQGLTTGQNNIIVSNFSTLPTTNSNCIYLGSPGVAAENATIRIGGSTQTAAYMTAVYGVSPSINQMVSINASGQLSSSSLPVNPYFDVSWGNSSTTATASFSGMTPLAITSTNFTGTFTETNNNSAFTSSKFDDNSVPGEIRWLGSAAAQVLVTYGVSFSVSSVLLATYQMGVAINGTGVLSSGIYVTPSAANLQTHAAYSKVITMNHNDVLEIVIASVAGGNSITISNVELRAVVMTPMIV